jgi:hypothetical protein
MLGFGVRLKRIYLFMFEGEEMSKEIVAEVISLIELGLIAPEDMVKCLRKANSEPEKAQAKSPAQYSDIVSNGGFDPRTQRTSVEMSDARIKGIFSYYGQFVSGKELAMLRVIETMLKENK